MFCLHIFIFQLSILLSLWLVPVLNSQHVGNKTKRTLTNEGVNYGEPNTAWFYTDNLKPQVTPRNTETDFPNSKPLALVELQPVKIFEPPKEIPQPVIYEFQQTPTNLVQSVKQLLGPDTAYNPELPQYKAPLFQNQNPNILTSETIVSPVQHSHVIRNHNHHLTGPRVHPLYNVQPTYQIPKKYAYVNGKIIYDPSSFQIQQPPLQTAPNFFNNQQTFHPQQLNRQQLINYHNRYTSRPKLAPPVVHQMPVNLPTITKLQPPKMQSIDTPSQPPPNRERHNEGNREEEKPVVEEEVSEEEIEEKSRHQEEEYDPYEDDRPFNEKYSFEYEDGDHLKEEEEDDRRDGAEEESDSNRGSSRHRYVTSKVKKYPKKKYRPAKKSEHYYSSKYEYPDKYHPKKKNHKMHYKGYKYSKNFEDPDAGFSENVPVIHKQKLFKEKWYVSKSLSDRKKFDD